MPHDSSESMVRWMAQTVHQAHHQDQPGTFKECPRDICASAAEHLRQLEEEETCGECGGVGFYKKQSYDTYFDYLCSECGGTGRP